jgi:pimeloyl-ACP methyl ester carboxylesterase
VSPGHLLLCCVLLLPASAAHAFPTGKSAFNFDDGHGLKINVLVYQPAKFDRNSPIQFAMHGMSRDASACREHWTALAEREQVLVIAPHFEQTQFRRTDDYALGPIRAGKRSIDSLILIEKLFDYVRKETGSQRVGYRIFGHSAGAQFAHHLMMLVPENRAEWAIAANANRYTWPEWRAEKGAFPLPNGLLKVERAEGKLKQALGNKLVIMLGETDNDPQHHQVTHGAEVDQQGLERLSRGRNFFKAAQAAAGELNVTLRWTMKTVPNTGHDHAAMTRAAIELMYPSGRKS